MVAAIAIGAGSAISAGIGAISSASASKAAAGAATNAANLNEDQYAQTRSDQLPYIRAGYSALQPLQDLATSGATDGGPNYLDMAAANLPGTMTQAELEATPGYKFNLSQGLKSTQSAAAARGLGVSGAALKGAATYATGLADSTYQNQFANKQSIFGDYLGLNTGQQGNITNRYNRLSGVATLGESAATSTGAQGVQTANSAGGFLTQAGQATGAGIIGAGNAVTGSANSGISNYLMYQGLTNGINGGGTGGYANAPGANLGWDLPA